MANQFFAMFWGRTDVYAKRGRNGGYFSQCDHRWNDRICPRQRGEKIRCEDCENTKWTKLTVGKIVDHLAGYKEDGSDVIGVYPLLPDGTCRMCGCYVVLRARLKTARCPYRDRWRTVQEVG